jgi:hypothetical protein
MQLLLAHQILISAAITLATIFGVRSAVVFSRSGGAVNVAMAIASLLLAVALALYLRAVRAKWRAIKRP